MNWNSERAESGTRRKRPSLATVAEEVDEQSAELARLALLIESDLGERIRHVNEQLTEVGRRLDELGSALHAFDGLEGTVRAVNNRAEQALTLLRSSRDNISLLAERLDAARRSPEYQAVFDESNPLVTVRIATYQRTDELMNVSLPSVLSQTHQNLDIVIVNDGPNPQTEAAVTELGDPRIRYSAFPHRSLYPDVASARWFVAGSPGMNEGIRSARGHWIAPLDEDDAFSPDHIERLVDLARENRAEVAYGAVEQRNQADGLRTRIFSYPPERGGFSFQGAMVHSSLRFFQYDQESWIVSEPGDWNLARRMLAAGVRFCGVDEVVATLNWIPYTHKDDGVDD